MTACLFTSFKFCSDLNKNKKIYNFFFEPPKKEEFLNELFFNKYILIRAGFFFPIFDS